MGTNLLFAGPASGQHQLCPSAEPWGQHPLGRRRNPQNLATKPSSSTGIKQLPRALKNKLYRIYRDICIYRALCKVSLKIYRSEKKCSFSVTPQCNDGATSWEPFLYPA